MEHNFNSQCKEDEWLYLEGLLPDNGFYIDLGSADGTINSNTKILDNMGWSGICVEPNPVYLDSYKDRTCKLIQKAVNKIDGSVYFDYNGEAGKITTKDHERVKVVSGISLETLVKENNVTQIDLLSIDLEGSEYDVLKPYFKTDLPKPKTIIAEYCTFGKQDHRLVTMLIKKGYWLQLTTAFNYVLTTI
jgi:FkbM family methyltransferase